MNPQTNSHGYYEILGVNRSATTDDVKRAFRDAAKHYHPDRNSDPNATAIFHNAREAYATLSDVGLRNEYDRRHSVDYQKGAFTQNVIDPICCSRCGNVTPYPRYGSFSSIVSGLIWCDREEICGVFCSSCARKVALKCSAKSAAFGWWGFAGIFRTPATIYRNAIGGERSPDGDAWLLWHNAAAFLRLGEFRLSAGLARQVAASSGEFAGRAIEQLADMRRRGLSTGDEVLDDPWKPRVVDLVAHGVMACLAPLMLAAMIAVIVPTVSAAISNDGAATAAPATLQAYRPAS